MEENKTSQKKDVYGNVILQTETPSNSVPYNLGTPPSLATPKSPQISPTKTSTTKTAVVPPVTQVSNIKQATVWNPATGEKQVVNVGDKTPAGFQLWTGGKATGEQARQAILDKQKSSEELASQAIIDVNKPEEVEENKPEAVQEDKWAIPSVDEIMKGLGIEKIKTNDYTQDYQMIESNYQSSLQALENAYVADKEAVEKQGQRATALMKAKLIKMGVKKTGYSFDSAVAGQEERNAQALRDLDFKYAQEKLTAKKNFETSYLAVREKENNEVFNAQTQNISNILQGQGLALNVWTAFNNRDQKEREMEQEAAQHLEKMNLEWTKLDADQQAKELDRFNDLLEKGYYDVMNPETIKMLTKMEEYAGMPTGYYTDAATGSYWDRTSNIMLKEAQTKQMEASTEKTLALLPYDIAEAKLDINKKSISLSGGGGSGGSSSKDVTAFNKDVESSISDLEKGRPWGQVWSNLAEKYGVIAPEMAQEKLAAGEMTAQEVAENDMAVAKIDRLLDKETWAKPGAFQERKAALDV